MPHIICHVGYINRFQRLHSLGIGVVEHGYLNADWKHVENKLVIERIRFQSRLPELVDVTYRDCRELHGVLLDHTYLGGRVIAEELHQLENKSYILLGYK